MDFGICTVKNGVVYFKKDFEAFDGPMILTKGFKSSFVIYSKAGFEKVIAEIEKLPDKEKMMMKRVVIGNSFEVELKNMRIYLPQVFADDAVDGRWCYQKKDESIILHKPKENKEG